MVCPDVTLGGRGSHTAAGSSSIDNTAAIRTERRFQFQSAGTMRAKGPFTVEMLREGNIFLQNHYQGRTTRHSAKHNLQQITALGANLIE